MKLQVFFLAISLISFMEPHFDNVFAQQVISAATLSGIVTDSTESPLGGATISAKNLATNQITNTISDAEGRFRFNYLQVGSYEIKTQSSGFAAFTQKITLTVGQSVNITLQMKPADVSAQVDIRDDELSVETSRTQVAETILLKEVENLPLNGRNFLDLALLIPGVSRTNTGSVQKFAETSAVPGTGISVAGQRNLANSFIVDGSSANDDSVELAGTFYSQEVIREFQVITNGAVAEFGRAQSGFINIITQSGTNNIHGKLYGFLRSQHFDARNPLAPTKDPLTQTQYGGSTGAPLVKNRTFFFGNFEQTRRSDSNVITISPANVAVINNRLTATGYRARIQQFGQL